MMINPSSYIRRFADADYIELIYERARLIEYLVLYEKKESAGDRTGDEWMMHPGPDVKYQMYLEYLSELCRLMKEKYNEDYVWGDKCLSDNGVIRYGREL